MECWHCRGFTHYTTMLGWPHFLAAGFYFVFEDPRLCYRYSLYISASSLGLSLVWKGAAGFDLRHAGRTCLHPHALYVTESIPIDYFPSVFSSTLGTSTDSKTDELTFFPSTLPIGAFYQLSPPNLSINL